MVAAVVTQSLSAQTIYEPATPSEFVAAAAVVQPGDTIVLPAGVLAHWGTLLLARDGTSEAPITVRAPSIYATTLTGETHFRVTADYIVIKGLRFQDITADYPGYPVHFAGGSYGRVTQCMFAGSVASSYVRSDPGSALDSASMLVIDHNFFTKGATNAINLVGLANPEFVGAHLIEHNLFRDAPVASGTNEAISLYSNGKHMGYQLNTVVRGNVFDNWDGDPDLEILTIKSGGNYFHGNVFAWCHGHFSLRRENNNHIEGNLFYRNLEGIRVYGDGHVIINNIFESLDRWGLYIGNSWNQGGGIEAKAATNCLIAHNTFTGIPYRTWVFYSSFMPDGGVVPSGNTLTGNIVESLVNTNDLVRDQTGFFDVNTIEGNLFYRVGGNLGPTGTNALTDVSAQLTGTSLQLRLSSGSPALNAGRADTMVTSDFFGSGRDAAPDIGHHEYNAIAAPLANPPLPPLPPNRNGFAALPLEAAFTAFPSMVVVGSAVNLDAAGSKGSIVGYTWDFGDGRLYSGNDAFIAYDWAAPGKYTVTLTVRDAGNITDSTQLQVFVTESPTRLMQPLRIEVIPDGDQWTLRAPLSPGASTVAQQSDGLMSWAAFHTFEPVAEPVMAEIVIPRSLTPPQKSFSAWRVVRTQP